MYGEIYKVAYVLNMKKGGGLQERMRLARLQEMNQKNPDRAKEQARAALPDLVQGDLSRISYETRKSLGNFAQKLVNYEFFALSISHGKRDQIALFDLLEEQGVLNEALLQEVREIGRKIGKDQEKRSEQFFHVHKDRKMNTVGLLVDTNEANASVLEQTEAFEAIQERAYREGRVLFQIFLEEMLKNAYVYSVTTKIRRLERVDNMGGFDLAMRDTEEAARTGIDPAHQSAVVQWFRFAKSCMQRKKKAQTPQEQMREKKLLENMVQELQDLAFQETVGTHVTLEDFYWRGAPVRCRIFVTRDQSPLALCKIMLEGASGVHIAEGYVSRITGDITVNETLVTSAEEVFTFFQAEHVAKLLKKSVLNAIHALWHKESLQEAEEVFLDGEEGEEGQNEEVVHDHVVHEQRKRESEIFREDRGSREGGEGEPARVEKKAERKGDRGSLAGYSWRHVLHALRRCGVQVVLSGDHPKLRYQGKTIDYLNRHDDDPRRNRHVVHKTLRALGISVEEFKKKL